MTSPLALTPFSPATQPLRSAITAAWRLPGHTPAMDWLP